MVGRFWSFGLCCLVLVAAGFSGRCKKNEGFCFGMLAVGV